MNTGIEIASKCSKSLTFVKQFSITYIIGFFFVLNTLTGISQENFKHCVFPFENEQELNSESLQIKGALTFFGHKRSVVIQNIEDIYSLIRTGTDPELCKKIFQDIDLTDKTVIGLNIITNSSEKPKIINHKIYFDKKDKVLTVYIDYKENNEFKGQKIAHPYWFKIPSTGNDLKVIYYISKIPKQPIL